jgi:hypothetical protein
MRGRGAATSAEVRLRSMGKHGFRRSHARKLDDNRSVQIPDWRSQAQRPPGRQCGIPGASDPPHNAGRYRQSIAASVSLSVAPRWAMRETPNRPPRPPETPVTTFGTQREGRLGGVPSSESIAILRHLRRADSPIAQNRPQPVHAREDCRAVTDQSGDLWADHIASRVNKLWPARAPNRAKLPIGCGSWARGSASRPPARLSPR